MEFEGRITRVLPAKSGTRNDGTRWVDLSFVFAYYENGEQRFEDSVLVSTFDTNIINSITPYLAKQRDAEGKEKVVYENDCAKMLVPHIPCRCGFSLRAKTVKKKDGSGFIVIQESRCYKLDVSNGAAMVSQHSEQPQVYQPQQPVFPPRVDQYGNPVNEQSDDLPF